METIGEDDDAVYQYYTIIDNSNSLIAQADGNFTLIGNPVNEDGRQIMLLSLSQNENDDEGSEVLLETVSDDVAPLETESEINGVSMPDVEYVPVLPSNSTLEADENLIGFDPDIISVKPEQLNDEEIEDENLDAHEGYHKVLLDDGSFAFIDNTVWNTLIKSTSKDSGSTSSSSSSSLTQQQQPLKTIKKEKKFACAFAGCDKVYSTSHHLMVHARNHSGNRPYHCPFQECGKSFATGYSLKAHLRTHTGEAPYGCTVCPKSFKTSGDLQKHMRTHTGEKPFKCPVEGCDKSFTTSNIRKVHIRSHTGERPYACTYPNCKKAFASATNFKNHMRIHSGEKPYQCPVFECGKRFTEYSSLFKHNVVHKVFVPLICEYCNQQCKHESTLKAHMQAVHKLVITEDGTEIRLDKEFNGVYLVTSS